MLKSYIHIKESKRKILKLSEILLIFKTECIQQN